MTSKTADLLLVTEPGGGHVLTQAEILPFEFQGVYSEHRFHFL